MSLGRLLAGSLLPLAAACAPALDWREVRPDDAALVALFPCKPERNMRRVMLAGREVALQLLGCRAEGTTWGLSTADMGDAGRVSAALAELRGARARNLAGREEDAQPRQIKGMGPFDQALRFRVSGQRADGSPLAEQAMVFSHGTRVYHAAALGGAPGVEAVETFFGGLRLQP